jgi:hypothetical protein
VRVLGEKRRHAVLQRRVQEGADRHGPRQAPEEEAELPHGAAGSGGAQGASPAAAPATTLTGARVRRTHARSGRDHPAQQSCRRPRTDGGRIPARFFSSSIILESKDSYKLAISNVCFIWRPIIKMGKKVVKTLSNEETHPNTYSTSRASCDLEMDQLEHSPPNPIVVSSSKLQHPRSSPRARKDSSTQGHRKLVQDQHPTTVGPSFPTRCVARARPIAVGLHSSKTDVPTVAGLSSPAADPSSPRRRRPELTPSPPVCARPRPTPPPPLA